MKKNRHPIEKVGEYRGFKFVITFNSMGYRCGYVMIPSGNPLFLNIKSRKDWKTKEGYSSYLSKRVSNFSYFNVHGGITLESVESDFPIHSKKRQLVIGFDTAHCGDSPDYDTFEKYYPEDSYRISRLRDIFGFEGIVRSKGYVQSNCEGLIDQLITTEHRVISRNKVRKGHCKHVGK